MYECVLLNFFFKSQFIITMLIHKNTVYQQYTNPTTNQQQLKQNPFDKKKIIKKNKPMTQNKQQHDPSHTKHIDFEDSSLLGSSARDSIAKNIQHQRQKIMGGHKSACTWVLWLGVLFCIVFGLVVYRYADSQQEHGNDWSGNQVNYEQNLKPLHNSVSFQPIDSSKKAKYQQTKNTKKTPQKDQEQIPEPDNNIIDETTSQIPQNIQQQQSFPSPYTIWLFSTSQTSDYTHNIEHYSSPDKSTVQRVSTQNYGQLIKSKPVLKALDLLNVLQLSQEKLEYFVQQLVMFTLVQENGGVIVGGDLVLTEGMDERRLMKRVDEEGKGFGMFVYGGTEDQEQNGKFQIDFENYFVGAKKHFWLLKQLIPKMSSALQQEIKSTSPSSENLLKRYTNQLSQILQRKYHFYAQLEQQNGGKPSFSEYIKVFSFGEEEQLNIASPYLLNLSRPAQFQYLSTYSEESLQELIGPLNPIVHLPLEAYSQFLTQLKTSPDHPILPDSFLYRHMLSFSSSYSNIKPLSPSTNLQQYSLWKLPKILWTFVKKLDQKSSLHDHFIANLIAKAKQSQFELIVLTQETIQAVLEGKELHEIFSNFKKDQAQSNRQQNQQNLSQLVKWYLLKNYGGVFVDFGYFLLDNLNWVTMIRSNQNIFNNIHKDPEVFMFHNHSAVEKWSVNINSGTKIAHNLTYLVKGFVAAVKNSTFVVNELESLLGRLKEPTNAKKYSTQTPQQTESKKSFKIWSISSLLGGQKMDLIMKGRNSQCFDFKDSLSQFLQKYGSLGYVSKLVTDVSPQQLNKNLFSLDDDSIFRPFFVSNVLDTKEIEKVKSLKEVSLSAQKIKK